MSDKFDFAKYNGIKPLTKNRDVFGYAHDQPKKPAGQVPMSHVWGLPVNTITTTAIPTVTVYSVPV